MATVRSCNFEDSTLSGFGTWETATPGVSPSDLPKITVINDPTPRALGKVGRFRYRKLEAGDDNTSLVQPGGHTAPGTGESRMPIGMTAIKRFTMKWYITSSWRTRALADGSFQAKLIYLKHSQYWGNGPNSRLTLAMMGTEFLINYNFNDALGDVINASVTDSNPVQQDSATAEFVPVAAAEAGGFALMLAGD